LPVRKELRGATVLEICSAENIACVEADLTLDDVYRADEMFCTGTMGELAAVTKVGWTGSLHAPLVRRQNG